MCENYALDLLAMSVVLALFAIAGLVYTARCARQSVLGRRLLDACAGDYPTAVLAIDNVRADAALLADMVRHENTRSSETRH